MKRPIAATIAALVLSAGILSAQAIVREVNRTDEKEVRLSLNSSFGSVNIKKGDAEKIVRVRYRSKEKKREPALELQYAVRKGVGDLRMEMHPEDSDVNYNDEGDGVRINADVNFSADVWHVELTDAVPIAMEVELGAGKSDFDLTGLILNELDITTGASSSRLDFGEKNKGEIKKLRIESGVSKFVANNLNNANFRTLEFNGGVGTYVLDFGGSLNRDVSVDINVGLGAMTIVVPKEIGLRVKYEDSWLSNLSLDDDEFVRKRKGIYESQNYADAAGRMEVHVESGLGTVRIKRSK
ncbi:MAG: hypothetical protein HUU02_15195 [Bacteroidetes bacterium]|nr:hypothetical protein [Bacteroidota bacterium]